MSMNGPHLTESQITIWVGEQNIKKGISYFRNDAIFDARRENMILRARCSGSYADGYNVEVQCNGKGIVKAHCSCPVGDGGHCKHVAALLLTWQDRPDEFVRVEPIDRGLERRSKEELVILIKRMIRQYPDLELLLEISASANATVDPASYAKQAKAILQRDFKQNRTSFETSSQLGAIQETGDDFFKHKKYIDARAVYEGLSVTIMNYYNTQIFDDDGWIGDVVSGCVKGLEKCFK